MMGFREELISNWEDKTIEYGGQLFYIIKQFTFEGKEYLYGIDKETYDKETINVVFLYRIKDGKIAEPLLVNVVTGSVFQLWWPMSSLQKMSSRS